MNPPDSNCCIGIDLTQSVPHLAVASGSGEVKNSIPENTPPAALLPVLQGESIIVGATAHKHRRGVGDSWPPECQIPVGGNYENGVGRVPLVCAWTRLAELSNRKFSGSLGDTQISWKPPGQRELHSSAEKIIADSVQAWEKEYHSKKTVVVIPDSLGEISQQALVDNCSSFLIPRPIAVAMSWCRENAGNFADAEIQATGGLTLGHVLVVTLPFDRWEVVPIEIRAIVHENKFWLIPIRNRVAGGGELPRMGVNFFLAAASSNKSSLASIWKTVFGSPSPCDAGHVDPKITDRYSLVRSCIENGFLPANRNDLYLLDGWNDIFASTQSLTHLKFRKLLSNIYTKQLSHLPETAQAKCLGVLVDGSCSTLPVDENGSIGDFIANSFEGLKTNIFNGSEAARGAAITAYALEHHLPSYRETIIPVDIHYHGKNKLGDYVNAYKLLVEGKTVEAGKEYKSQEPVRGLNIKQGEHKLTLTLRRSKEKDSYLFRKVTADIPKPATRDEEVKIFAHLRPGQGFAKVFVDSVNEGVFRKWLDWRTMEDCDPPPPPPLAYLPEVSRVVQNKHMWEVAEFHVKGAIEELKTGSRNLETVMKDLREKGPGRFNQWPLADVYDAFRGQIPKGDIFRHYGVWPSDGDLDSVSSPCLMKEFAHECEKRFVHNRTTPAQRDQIQRTASWMYLACPPAIINKVRKDLKLQMAQVSQEDLHTIGLCWCKPKDIELFFIALEQRLLQDIISVNEWLRACRNIVRFRDAALHPDIIPDKRLETIVNKIIAVLKKQVRDNNFSTIFNNCILTCLYLLKRRRYNNEFLNSKSHGAIIIEMIFKELLEKQGNNLNKKQHTIISVTLKFLRKEATRKDIDGSVLTI